MKAVINISISLFLGIISCSDIEVNDSSIPTQDSVTVTASFVEDFFNLKDKINDSHHTLSFYEQAQNDPMCMISLEQNDELEYAKSFKCGELEGLVLFNSGRISYHLFLKNKKVLRNEMINLEGFVDSITFISVNDTLGYISLSRSNEFIKNSHSYYFISEKNGIYPTAITVSNEKNKPKVVIIDNGFELNYEVSKMTIPLIEMDKQINKDELLFSVKKNQFWEYKLE